MLVLIPTEEQTMHMRNAETIPSSYQNVLCGIWSQNKLQRAWDTLVGCLCNRNMQVVSCSAPGIPTCKVLYWNKSFDRICQKYFMETNPLTAKISNLLRDLWPDLLNDLRITQSTWGHTEKKGKHLYPPHWHFGISQVTTNLQVVIPRGEADRPPGASGGNCSSYMLTSLLQQFFSKHWGVEKQILQGWLASFCELPTN